MNFKNVLRKIVVLCTTLALTSAFAAENGFLFVGSKTNGIVRYEVEQKNGALTQFAVAAGVASPQFIALHPTRPLLYTINTVTLDGKKTGVISAFTIRPDTGALTFLNQQPSGGGGPTHLTVDHAGKNVLVANYGSGSVSVFPLKDDGSLAASSAFIQHHGSSVHPQRQEGPHAHQIMTDAKDHFALVCDLGLDKVMIYKFDPKNGTLTANEPAFATLKPGAGPRHLAFHPDNHFVYVIDELDSTMTAFTFDPQNGTMKEFQTVSTLPADFTGKNFPAEVYVHPSGKFLYGSNRGHDSIVVYAIAKDGKLSLVQHQSTQGKIPRHFSIDRRGQLMSVENQDSNSVVTFRIDPHTGKLQPTGQTAEVNVPSNSAFYP